MIKLFYFPLFFDVIQKIQLEGEFKLNYTLLAIAIITSLLGSSVQITHTVIERKIKWVEILAIYVSGVFVAYFAYEIGNRFNNFALTGVSSAILSYISIDFILTVKKSILFIINGVTKKLPDVIVEILKNIILKK